VLAGCELKDCRILRTAQSGVLDSNHVEVRYPGEEAAQHTAVEVLVCDEPEQEPRSARMAGEESFAQDVDFER